MDIIKNDYEQCKKCTHFKKAPYWYPYLNMCGIGKYTLCQNIVFGKGQYFEIK